MQSSTSSNTHENLFSVTTPGLPKEWQWAERWSDRQERAQGFDQDAVRLATIWICGCNGLGRTAAEVLLRKGYKIGLCDHDIVDITNLNRTFWRHDAVGEFKVTQAMKELAAIAPEQTEIRAFIGRLEEAFESGVINNATVCVVGIDNDAGRAFAARELRRRNIPGVFYALSKDTFTYEVFVQEPGKSCWACAHPDRYRAAFEESKQTACPKVPSIADPCLIAVGFCCYAIDSLVMNRPRSWNFRLGYLHGEIPESSLQLPRRPDCPLCGVPA